MKKSNKEVMMPIGKSSEKTRTSIGSSKQKTRALFDQIQRDQGKPRKEMAGTIKYTTELILTSGERTKELSRSKGGKFKSHHLKIKN